MTLPTTFFLGMSQIGEHCAIEMEPLPDVYYWYATERTMGNLGDPRYARFSDKARRRRKRQARYRRGREGVRPRMRAKR